VLRTASLDPDAVEAVARAAGARAAPRTRDRPAGLTEREIEVLRLVADGFDTSEIAGSLAYSERTIKNIIHDVTARLNLRNRSHAVAYAVRQGLI
jgi:DNA-binding NarL/FixJ family response regulator